MQAHPGTLCRRKAKADAREVIHYVRPPLRKLLKRMIHIYGTCAIDSRLEHFALLHSYRNIIEMLDGIDVLFGEAVWDPAQALIRSAFENLLNVIYLTESDQERRGLCYLFVEIQMHINNLKIYIYEHRRGLMKTLRREGMTRIASKIEDNYRESIIDTIVQHEKILQQPEFSELYNLYYSLKPRRRKNIKRYSLIGGPKHIIDLAEICERKGMYLTVYDEWSDVVHGSDMRRTFTTERTLRPLRHPRCNNDPYKWARFALLFGIESTLCLLSELRPGEDEEFSDWFELQFSNFFEGK